MKKTGFQKVAPSIHPSISPGSQSYYKHPAPTVKTFVSSTTAKPQPQLESFSNFSPAELNHVLGSQEFAYYFPQYANNPQYAVSTESPGEFSYSRVRYRRLPTSKAPKGRNHGPLQFPINEEDITTMTSPPKKVRQNKVIKSESGIRFNKRSQQSSQTPWRGI